MSGRLRSNDAAEPIISTEFVEVVIARLAANKPLRRNLPGWGRIAIDRQLPFLCVYRKPARRGDEGTFRLVTSEAAYLTAQATRSCREGLNVLIEAVARSLSAQFGAFLLIEIWAGKPRRIEGPVTTAELRPSFALHCGGKKDLTGLFEEFKRALGQLSLGGQKARVALERGRVHPRGMTPLLAPETAESIGCRQLGVEVGPVFRDPGSGELFPAVLRQLRRRFSVALRHGTFHFASHHTRARPKHMHSLGPRAVVKAVWEVDRILAETTERLDFLLQVTPVNGEPAWHAFKRQRFEQAPNLHYRPLPEDPVVLKRELYRAPVERIEDPALALLFREKLDELERQITMLQDRNSPRFLHGSIQLYGRVPPELDKLAGRILREVPARSRDGGGDGLSAEQFARRARQEIAALQKQWAGLDARVEVRRDLTGLMVSRGNLLVSAGSRIPASRVEALIQHEVGTHVLTYHNGRAQRLRNLTSGLAGYDALQEGLAVLAEYLVGGLSKARLRLLAGRVIAASGLEAGASFIDTFRRLVSAFGFSQRAAFSLAVRTHRSGGLTKDAVYLKGLQKILDYLGKGGVVEDLFVGKIGGAHLSIMRELRWRGVLREPPMLPRYMQRTECLERLAGLRRGLTVLDLLKRRVS